MVCPLFAVLKLRIRTVLHNEYEAAVEELELPSQAILETAVGRFDKPVYALEDHHGCAGCGVVMRSSRLSRKALLRSDVQHLLKTSRLEAR